MTGRAAGPWGAGAAGKGGHTRGVAGRIEAPEAIVTDDGVPGSGAGVRSGDQTTQGDAGEATGQRAGEGPGQETRLGRFTLLRLLGEGGMGVVYTAWDELLDRRVAIKLVRSEHSGGDARARMLHEAKGLARLSHPNVVQIYEVSASDGRVFIAMEYIQGETLRVWTRERRAAGADRRELLDMYLQAGRGLAAAHAQGLVHRDFKPKSECPPQTPPLPPSGRILADRGDLRGAVCRVMPRHAAVLATAWQRDAQNRTPV